MYHPEASIVQVDEVHGGVSVARGADGIRKTMAAYIGLKPHMDVITHHTTVSGDFAITRSQVADPRRRCRGPSGRGPSPRHGGPSPPARRHLGVLHRPSLRRRRKLDGRGAAGD
jgi:hypothetical protein